jgi:hypothetical protein
MLENSVDESEERDQIYLEQKDEKIPMKQISVEVPMQLS